MAGGLRGGAATAAAIVAGLVAGCGGSDPDPGPQAEPRPREKAEGLPELPEGWTKLENKSQGLAFGVPPGWKRGTDCLRGGTTPGTTSVICSPDKLVSLAVTADRSEQALELPPAEFAVRTMEGLETEGYRSLDPEKPKDFKGHYNGTSLKASGKAATGVRQNVKVVVLRRDDYANFTAVIAANAERPTGPAVELAERSLRTLRSQPTKQSRD